MVSIKMPAAQAVLGHQKSISMIPAVKSTDFSKIFAEISSKNSGSVNNSAASGAANVKPPTLLSEVMGEKLQAELATLRAKITRKGNIDARDLLLYQIRSGEFGLRVELISKVADSLLATTRKLQSGQ